MSTTVTGFAIDTDGAAQAGAWLQITKAFGNEAVFEDEDFLRERITLVQSGPGGEFEFQGIPPGRYCIGPAGELPQAKTGDACPFLVPIEVMSNQPRLEMDVTFHRAPTIGGIVRGAGGSPLENVVLFASIAGAANYLIATTDGQGRFSFGPLVDGEYTITGELYGPGSHVFQGTQKAGPGEANLILSGSPTGKLRGEVVQGALGSTTLDGHVLLIAGVGTPREQTRFTWPVDGPTPQEFQMDRLPLGAYRLIYASGDALRHGLAEIEVTRELLEVDGVVLPALEACQLDFVHGWPGASAEAMVHQDGRLVMEAWPEEGEIQRIAVPAGKLRVVVSVDEGRLERVFEVEAAPGEPCRVVLAQ